MWLTADKNRWKVVRWRKRSWRRRTWPSVCHRVCSCTALVTLLRFLCKVSCRLSECNSQRMFFSLCCFYNNFEELLVEYSIECDVNFSLSSYSMNDAVYCKFALICGIAQLTFRWTLHLICVFIVSLLSLSLSLDLHLLYNVCLTWRILKISVHIGRIDCCRRGDGWPLINHAGFRLLSRDPPAIFECITGCESISDFRVDHRSTCFPLIHKSSHA